LSCANPNLQNVPRDNKIRNMITVRPGYKLIAADLSQMELRILAMVSGDKAMQQAFRSKADFHTMTACTMFNIPVNEFSKENPKHQELRTAAKCVIPSTRIPTQNGILRIKDLCNNIPEVDKFEDIKGVQIIHPDGRYVPAVQFYNGGIEKCKKITLENGMNLTGTHTHKIYVLENNQVVDKQLSDVKIDDIVLLQGCVPNHSNKTYLSIDVSKGSRILPPLDSSVFSSLGEIECKILGYIFVYGLKLNKNLRLIFDTRKAMEVCESYLKHAGMKGYLKHIEKSQYILSFAYDKVFYDLLDMLEVFQEEKIPEFVFRVDKASAAAFLSVIIEKALDENGEIVESSKQLLEDIQLLLFLQYGIITYVEKKNDKYLLRFSTSDKDIIISEIFSLALERKTISDIILNTRLGIKFHKVNNFLSYACMKVIDIEDNIQSEVYDLFVPEGNHFNSNGFISHNSINFGIAYQMSPASLAAQLNIPLDKAEEFIQRFYTSYPDVKRWIDSTMQFCMKHGYVETVHGRRRYLPAVFSSDNSTKMRALRQAVNTPIQGTASDCTGYGLIKNQEYLDKSGKRAYQVGVIHDCILVECHEDDVEEVSKKLIENMTTNIPKITIQLEADLTITDRWEK